MSTHTLNTLFDRITEEDRLVFHLLKVWSSEPQMRDHDADCAVMKARTLAGTGVAVKLDIAIQQWVSLADEAERSANLCLIHPNVAKAQADCYSRTARALEIQRDTGVALCSCCLKPFGEDKPYWMRGGHHE